MNLDALLAAHDTNDDRWQRRLYQKPDGPALWEAMYWRSFRAWRGRTFRQAITLFAKEHEWAWPHPDWKYMPIEPIDLYRQVRDVPIERLRR
jgi:hypothetical protein